MSDVRAIVVGLLVYWYVSALGCERSRVRSPCKPIMRSLRQRNISSFTCFGNVGKYGKRIKFYVLCSETLSPDKLRKNNADKIPLLSYTKCKERESGIDGDTHTELYVFIRQQHKKKEHFVAGGSVAQWSKALDLGTSLSISWVLIPPLPVALYLWPSPMKRVMLFD